MYEGYKFPILRSVNQAAGAVGSDLLVFGPVPSGKLWVINWVSMEDDTTAFTGLRIGILQLGEANWIMEDISCLVARLYWHEGPIYVPEGCVLGCLFTGATAADDLHAYISGFQTNQPLEASNE